MSPSTGRIENLSDISGYEYIFAQVYTICFKSKLDVLLQEQRLTFWQVSCFLEITTHCQNNSI